MCKEVSMETECRFGPPESFQVLGQEVRVWFWFKGTQCCTNGDKRGERLHFSRCDMKKRSKAASMRPLFSLWRHCSSLFSAFFCALLSGSLSASSFVVCLCLIRVKSHLIQGLQPPENSTTWSPGIYFSVEENMIKVDMIVCFHLRKIRNNQTNRKWNSDWLKRRMSS